MNRHWLFVPVVAVLAIALGFFATLWATPSVIMDRAWNRLSERAGINHMAHTPQIDASRREIVRPSPDLAYSVCAFDLRDGPLEIHVAPVPDHYWSLTIFDQDTNAVLVRSDRDTRGKPINLVVAKRGQRAPSGMEQLDMPGNKGVALIRILLKGRDDFAMVEKARAPSFCRPVKS